jgi:hypothetical protein
MESILDIYKRPYDPNFPVLCMDETTKQLIKEVCRPLPLSPGHGERIDYEYERNGVGHLFMFFEPLAGFRRVFVDEAHTKREWVKNLQEIMKIKYKDAKKVTLVMDNLATHSPAALYEFLPAEEARQLLKRLDFQYTPKHGSWLNMAEIEFSILSKECLDRRIADSSILKSEISIWGNERNKKNSCVNWQFATENARIKLRKLYPTI